MSNLPFAFSWGDVEFGEGAEYDEDDDREEQEQRYELSRNLASGYTDDDDDDDLEYGDDREDRWAEDDRLEYGEAEDDNRALVYDDDRQEVDERWETEEEHTATTLLAGDRIRNPVVPVVSSAVDALEDDERWETEEEHTTTTQLAGGPIRNPVVPVVSSPIDSLRTGETEHVGEFDSEDTVTNPVDSSKESTNKSVVSHSDVTTSPESTDVGLKDAEIEREGDQESVAAEGNEPSAASPEIGQQPSALAAAESTESNVDPTESTETTNRTDGNGTGGNGVAPDGQVDEAIASFRPADRTGDASPALADRDSEGLGPVVAATAYVQSQSHAQLGANAINSGDAFRYGIVKVAVAPSLGGESWRLFDSIPQDLAGLELALRALLHDQSEIGRNLADWLMDPNVLRWILATSVAAVAFEAARRKVRQSSPDDQQPGDGLPSDSRHAVLLRLFPELFGLAPTART